MREGARRVIITVSALALIGITVFCISGTVHSSEKVERREREKYYREIEAEYVKEVRFFLNEEGYSNSGVMPQQNPRHVRGFLYKSEQKFRPKRGTFVPPGYIRAVRIGISLFD